jgi:N12 class adenine-specific DNA methylase
MIAIDKLQETIAHHIETTGPKGKADANIRAIKALDNGCNLDDVALFTGFGGLKWIFEEHNQEWASRYQELKSILNEEEYNSLNATILNAHYTTPEVVKLAWSLVEAYQFKPTSATRILDPSCGTGYFKLFAPESAQSADWTMIELDKVTGQIAKSLNRDANIIIRGFEQTSLPGDYYDLAISNIPFGSYQVYDPEFKHYSAFRIHNYFLLKMIELVQPGGLVCVIISSGFMDAGGNGPIRDLVATKANLVDAYRFPCETFKKFGTEVTTDLLLFQKLGDNVVRDRKPQWTQVVESLSRHAEYWDTKDHKWKRVLVNKFLASNQRIAGITTTDQLHPGRAAASLMNKMPLEDCLYKMKAAIIENAEGISLALPKPSTAKLKLLPVEYQHLENGQYFIVNDELYQRTGASMVEITDRRKAGNILAGLRVLYAMNQLIHCMKNDDPEQEYYRDELNSLYDAYVNEYGVFRKNSNRKVWEGDWRYYQLTSLETPDNQKTDIFRVQTIRPVLAPEAVNPQDALIASLVVKGKVDLDYMQELLPDCSLQFITDSLVGQIFFDHTEQRWMQRDEFLSGDVVERLKAEREHGIQENIEALENAQPLYILPNADISIKIEVAERLGGDSRCNLNPQAVIKPKLGQPWLSIDDIKTFIADLIHASKTNIAVGFSKTTGTWQAKYDSPYYNSANDALGTPDYSAVQLVECALNNRSPVVKMTVFNPDGTERKVTDHDKTEAARAKMESIERKFAQWCFEDVDRAYRLTLAYNKTMNRYVERKYDGSFINFEELSDNFTLRPYQRDYVWASIQEPVTAWGVAVGGGKTLMAGLLAVRLKRMGLVNKSMVTVLKSTVNQFAEQIRMFIPGAKVLAPSEKDFQPGNRRQLISAIRTGDWDLVILSHSQFNAISMSTEAQMDYLTNERRGLEQDLKDIMKTAGTKGAATKGIQSRLRSIEKQIAKITNRDITRGTVDWEDLGLDLLIVDEWSASFKNLPFRSRLTQIAGINPTGCVTALDAFMKIRYMANTGKRVVIMDGTPIRNSIAEAYILQKTIAYERLEKAGILEFDIWARQFAEIVNAPEITGRGDFKIKARFSKFTQLPLLRKITANKLHVLTLRQLRELAPELQIDLPEVINVNVKSPSTDYQFAFVQNLLDRADAIVNRKVDPKDDNMLVVTADGRKNALDPRLVTPNAENSIDLKLNKCAANVYRIWKLTERIKGVQSIFCDLSTPSSSRKNKDEETFENFVAYYYIKDLLVELGIPSNEIRFVHDVAQNPKKRQELFMACLKGEVRVILGSTSMLGTGVNIQRLLIAQHNIDAPWRPGDVEQRIGRMERHGNLMSKCFNFVYVTEGKNGLAGFDAYMWQILERKAHFIYQFMEGMLSEWEAEDIGDNTMKYAELKAQATGDKRIIRKVELEAIVAKYEMLVGNTQSALANTRIAQGSKPQALRNLVQQIDKVTERFNSLKQLSGEGEQYTGFYDGVVRIEKPSKQSQEEVQETQEEDSDHEATNSNLTQYEPLRVPVIVNGEPVSDVRQLGEYINQQFHELGQHTGAFKIGEWVMPDGDTWNIVVVSNVTAGCYLKHPDDNFGHKFTVTSKPHQTVRNLHNVQATLASNLENLKISHKQAQMEIEGLQPKIKQLESELAEYLAVLSPSSEELNQLNEELGVNDEISYIDDDDSDNTYSHLDVAHKAEAAVYEGVDYWVVRQIKESFNEPFEWEDTINNIVELAIPVIEQHQNDQLIGEDTDEDESKPDKKTTSKGKKPRKGKPEPKPEPNEQPKKLSLWEQMAAGSSRGTASVSKKAARKQEIKEEMPSLFDLV